MFRVESQILIPTVPCVKLTRCNSLLVFHTCGVHCCSYGQFTFPLELFTSPKNLNAISRQVRVRIFFSLCTSHHINEQRVSRKRLLVCFGFDCGLGMVDSIQPLSYGYPESQVKRRLSQSTRSNDDGSFHSSNPRRILFVVFSDSVSCQLTASQRRQFYDTSSRQWIVTDAVLEELGNDLQSIIACTAQDDFILFSTRTRIKPRRPMTITRRLTLSAQPRGSLFRNGVLVETPRKVRLTCPDRGSLLTVR